MKEPLKMAPLRVAHGEKAEPLIAGGAEQRLQLKVGGMACSFCVASLTKAVERLPGVLQAAVNLAHEEVLVRFDPLRIAPQQIGRAIVDLGYTVRDADKVRTFEEEQAELRRARDFLLAATAFTIGALALMALMWMGALMRPAPLWLRSAMPALALATIFWPGRHILVMAWASLRRGILNQHVLLEFGAWAGVAGGFLGLLWPLRFPSADFFAVAVFITTYHLLSGYVSLRVRTRSSQAVRKLLALVPPMARVVRDGGEQEIPIEEVRTGDLVRIRPGESVPVDGVVEEGASGVDQSLVTGESMAEEKNPGDPVIGGSVNQTGTLLVRVTKTGQDSFLQQVARQVEEARALKPGMLALADRVLKIYVLGVLIAAGAALLLWVPAAWLVTGHADGTRAIFAILAVLVMGYPCALGMATPLAMIRGGGMAAEHGILMRSAEAFQAIKDVKTIVLDKTGTITRGKSALRQIVPLDGRTETEVLRWAATAEYASEHPLGRALVTAAESRGFTPPAAADFRAFAGKGVAAEVEGRRVAVGSPKFIASLGVDIAAAQAWLEKLQAAGNTTVMLAADDALAALFAIGDEIKPDAREAIARMRAAGLEPLMLTGDNHRTARAVAEQVGIADYRAEVLPGDKAAVVRELQGRGHRVAMVGDGINDAPALMQADVGVAIGAGTDIAIESADIVLIGERLGPVVDAYFIGKNSYRKTVQNLSLAFSFNGVGVPIAVSGLLHPVWAMLAMVASVTMVLANSFGGRLLPQARRAPRRRLSLQVDNMHCAGCLATIQRAVGALPGVERVEGYVAEHRVEVVFREGQIHPDGISAAMVEHGFQVEVFPQDNNAAQPAA